ncbi:MAG TPA: DNA-directed RNA polymerase subunit H [Candidatus Nanoarchaeia archaeon]|nr:DNA-directed RNA polymerase subunit H [Candidatus Nanoarchaeia archaeon]
MSEKQIDTTGHIFVPKHVKMTEEDAKVVLESLNISKKQMPKISKKDPAIIHMDLQTGDVLKIERKSPSAGMTTFYRVVI